MSAPKHNISFFRQAHQTAPTGSFLFFQKALVAPLILDFQTATGSVCVSTFHKPLHDMALHGGAEAR